MASLFPFKVFARNLLRGRLHSLPGCQTTSYLVLTHIKKSACQFLASFLKIAAAFKVLNEKYCSSVTIRMKGKTYIPINLKKSDPFLYQIITNVNNSASYDKIKRKQIVMQQPRKCTNDYKDRAEAQTVLDQHAIFSHSMTLIKHSRVSSELNCRQQFESSKLRSGILQETNL